MSKVKSWSRGVTLLTPRTRGWSKEEFKRNDYMEGLAIFSDFSEVDLGVSRQRVCTLEINHPDFEFNRRLIEQAPAMFDLLTMLLNAGKNEDWSLVIKTLVEKIENGTDK